jgi:hypothetical protein
LEGVAVVVEHIVCFKLKPGATAEQEQKLIAMLRGLKESVPAGIISLTVGKNITPERGMGYGIGLVVRFENKEGLAVYGPHPEHVKVKNYVAEVCENSLVVDYEA